jgi:hypothetical protein
MVPLDFFQLKNIPLFRYIMLFGRLASMQLSLPAKDQISASLLPRLLAKRAAQASFQLDVSAALSSAGRLKTFLPLN